MSTRAAGKSDGMADARSDRRLVSLGVVGVVAVAVLLVGAVHLPVKLLIALLVLGVVLAGGRGARPGLLVGLGLFAAGVLGATTLALVPVGPGVRIWLQPGVAEPLNAAYAALEVGARPLAVSPEAAGVALGWAAVVVGFCGPVALVGRTRTRRVRVMAGLLAVCAGVAVLGIVHRILGLDEIFGVSGLPSGDVRDAFFAPFINPNHGGLLCALGIPLALGIGLRRDPAQSGALVLGALVCAGGAIVSGSRGALLAVVVGCLVFVLLSSSRVVVASVLSAVGLLGALAVLRGPQVLIEQLTGRFMPEAATPDALGQRPELWADALEMVSAAPLMGVGPGGFEQAWHLFDDDLRYANAVHAHQDLLQALAEQGVVVGTLWAVLVLLPLGLGIRYAMGLRLGRRRRVVAGLMGAMVALVVASLFGFPFRVGSLALIYVVLACTVLGAVVQSARPASARLVGLARGLELLTVGAGVALLAWGAVSEGPVDKSDLNSVDAHLEGDPLWMEGWLARADLHLATGDVAACSADLALAASTWPGSPWPRLAQAQLARRIGDDAAARRAWRTALALNLPNNDKARPWLEWAVEHEAEPAMALLYVVPDRADRLRDAGRLAEDLGDPLLAELLYQQAFDRDSSTGLPLARHQLGQGLPHTALNTLDKIPPQVVASCRGQVVLSRALLSAGEVKDAVAAGKAALRRCEAGDAAARTALARAQVASGDKDAVRQLARLVSVSPDDHALRRDLLVGLRGLGDIDGMAEHLEHLDQAGVATDAELEALERVRDGLPPR